MAHPAPPMNSQRGKRRTPFESGGEDFFDPDCSRLLLTKLAVLERPQQGGVGVGHLATLLVCGDVMGGEREFRDINHHIAILSAVAGSNPNAPLQRFLHGLRFLSGILEGKGRLGLQD